MRSSYVYNCGGTPSEEPRRPRGPRTPEGEPTEANERPCSSNSSISTDSFVPPPPPRSGNSADGFNEYRPRRGPKTPPMPPPDEATKSVQPPHIMNPYNYYHQNNYSYNIPSAYPYSYPVMIPPPQGVPGGPPASYYPHPAATAPQPTYYPPPNPQYYPPPPLRPTYVTPPTMPVPPPKPPAVSMMTMIPPPVSYLDPAVPPPPPKANVYHEPTSSTSRSKVWHAGSSSSTATATTSASSSTHSLPPVATLSPIVTGSPVGLLRSPVPSVSTTSRERYISGNSVENGSFNLHPPPHPPKKVASSVRNMDVIDLLNTAHQTTVASDKKKENRREQIRNVPTSLASSMSYSGSYNGFLPPPAAPNLSFLPKPPTPPTLTSTKKLFDVPPPPPHPPQMPSARKQDEVSSTVPSPPMIQDASFSSVLTPRTPGQSSVLSSRSAAPVAAHRSSSDSPSTATSSAAMSSADEVEYQYIRKRHSPEEEEQQAAKKSRRHSVKEVIRVEERRSHEKEDVKRRREEKEEKEAAESRNENASSLKEQQYQPEEELEHCAAEEAPQELLKSPETQSRPLPFGLKEARPLPFDLNGSAFAASTTPKEIIRPLPFEFNGSTQSAPSCASLSPPRKNEFNETTASADQQDLTSFDAQIFSASDSSKNIESPFLEKSSSSDREVSSSTTTETRIASRNSEPQESRLHLKKAISPPQRREERSGSALPGPSRTMSAKEQEEQGNSLRSRLAMFRMKKAQRLHSSGTLESADAEHVNRTVRDDVDSRKTTKKESQEDEQTNAPEEISGQSEKREESIENDVETKTDVISNDDSIKKQEPTPEPIETYTPEMRPIEKVEPIDTTERDSDATAVQTLQVLEVGMSSEHSVPEPLVIKALSPECVTIKKSTPKKLIRASAQEVEDEIDVVGFDDELDQKPSLEPSTSTVISTPRKYVKKVPVVTKAALKMPPPNKIPKKQQQRKRKGKVSPYHSPSPPPAKSPLLPITLPRNLRAEQEMKERRRAGSISSTISRSSPCKDEPVLSRKKQIAMDNTYLNELDNKLLMIEREAKKRKDAVMAAKMAESLKVNGEASGSTENQSTEAKEDCIPGPSPCVRTSSLHTPNTSEEDDVICVSPPPDRKVSLKPPLLSLGALKSREDLAKCDAYIEEQRRIRNSTSNRTSRDNSVISTSYKLSQRLQNIRDGIEEEHEEEEDELKNGGTLEGILYPRRQRGTSMAPDFQKVIDSLSLKEKFARTKDLQTHSNIHKRSEILKEVVQRQKELGLHVCKLAKSAIKQVEDDEEEAKKRKGNRRVHPDFEKSKRDAEIASINGYQLLMVTNRNLKILSAVHGLPRMETRFRKFVRVKRHPNGMASIISCDYNQLKANFGPLDIKFFERQFIRLGLAENMGIPLFAIGIMENAAEKLHDQFAWLAMNIPNMQVKVGSLTNKQLIETMSIRRYYEQAVGSLDHGTFRYGPMMSISMVGTKQEETGGNFTEMLKELEEAPFLGPIMPWGEFSDVEGITSEKSNDGPIFWVRPGEQMVPLDHKVRGTEQRHPMATRGGERREVEFQDRTNAHSDQVHEVYYKECGTSDIRLKSTAAVGVLQGIRKPMSPEDEEDSRNEYIADERRTVKEVVVFHAGDLHKVVTHLGVDMYEPPVQQCQRWVDDSTLNTMRREDIKYAKVELRENDMYFLPRNVVHQFRTVSACSSVAWHVRLRHYYSKEDPPPSSFEDPDYECDTDYSVANYFNCVNGSILVVF